MYIANGVWDELTVSWNDAPQASRVQIAVLEEMVSKEWVKVDVLDAISYGGPMYSTRNSLSLHVTSKMESLCIFASGESGDYTTVGGELLIFDWKC